MVTRTQLPILKPLETSITADLPEDEKLASKSDYIRGLYNNALHDLDSLI